MKYNINYLKALKTEQKQSEQMKSESVKVDSWKKRAAVSVGGTLDSSIMAPVRWEICNPTCLKN